MRVAWPSAATRVWAWPASTAAPPARLTTARSASFWPTPVGTAIRCWTRGCTCPRRNGPRTRHGGRRPAALPPRAWQRLAFREGTKGTQRAEFARLRVVVERDDLPGPELGLVVERGLGQEAKAKYDLSNADPKVPLLTLVQVGHTRWPVED